MLSGGLNMGFIKADDKVIWLLVIVRVHQLSSLMTDYGADNYVYL